MISLTDRALCSTIVRCTNAGAGHHSMAHSTWRSRAYGIPLVTAPLPPTLLYPHPVVPAPGATVIVAPGVRWLRMPLPFALDHINLWLLEDEIGGEQGW